jgi:hypothetical protein
MRAGHSSHRELVGKASVDSQEISELCVIAFDTSYSTADRFRLLCELLEIWVDVRPVNLQ